MDHLFRKAVLAGAFLCALALTACGETYNDEVDDLTHSAMALSDVVVPAGDFHTPLQYAYIHSSFNAISDFADGTKELSKPLPLKITIPSSESGTYVQISTSADFALSETQVVLGKTSFEYTNPLLATTYYWRLSASKTDFTGAAIHSFTTTSEAPRNLDLSGATNVRELGGYPSKLGGKIRQGLYYRGGALNGGTDTPSLRLTSAGLETFTHRMKVKSEIDLRMTSASDNNNETGNMAAGVIPGVAYFSFPINWNTNDMFKDCKVTIGKVFKTLAIEANYPVYLHCSIGTDRTGLISYLLGVLLGMKNADLYHDYLFSNFGNIGSSRASAAVRVTYQEDLKEYKKSTLAADCEAYLQDCLVSKEEIAAIRTIMIEQ